MMTKQRAGLWAALALLIAVNLAGYGIKAAPTDTAERCANVGADHNYAKKAEADAIARYNAATDQQKANARAILGIAQRWVAIGAEFLAAECSTKGTDDDR